MSAATTDSKRVSGPVKSSGALAQDRAFAKVLTSVVSNFRSRRKQSSRLAKSADQKQVFIPVRERPRAVQVLPKILLVQHGDSFRQAKSLVFGGVDFHALAISDEAKLEQCLAGEDVDVILADCRGAKESGLAFVEKLRRAQPSSKVVLVADRLDLRSIVRGIRLGLKDMHTPPLKIEDLLANFADFTGVEDRHRKAFCNAVTAHLVDFLLQHDAKPVAAGKASVAIPESVLQAQSTRNKEWTEDKPASPANEQATTSGLHRKLPADTAAIQLSPDELERRDAARAELAAQETAIKKQSERAEALMAKATAISERQADEAQQAEKLVALQEEKHARRATLLAEREAVLAEKEASLNAARSMIEAEQASLAEREKAHLTAVAVLKRSEQQARFQPASKPGADESVKALADLTEERQKIAAERQGVRQQKLQLEQELLVLRQDTTKERAAQAAAVIAHQAAQATLAQRETALQSELARITTREAQAKEAAAKLVAEEARLNKLATERTAMEQARADALTRREAELQAAQDAQQKRGEELAQALAALAEERQQIVVEREGAQRQKLQLEQELQALRQDLAKDRAAQTAAVIAQQAGHATLAQREAALQAELAGLATREASAKEAAAKLVADEARLNELEAERTASLRARETALKQQAATLQTEAARVAAVAADQQRQSTKARLAQEQAELAKGRALVALKLAELEKAEADIEIKRQRFAKEFRLPDGSARWQKAPDAAAASDTTARSQPTLTTVLTGFAKDPFSPEAASPLPQAQP